MAGRCKLLPCRKKTHHNTFICAILIEWKAARKDGFSPYMPEKGSCRSIALIFPRS